MEKIVNLTPHAIVLRVEGQDDLIIPPSGKVARLTSVEEEMDWAVYEGFEIPQARIVYGAIENLPETDSETTYIVSMPAAQALAAQDRFVDIRFPDTGKGAIRDADGNIIGTTRLLQAFPDDPKYREEYWDTEIKLHRHATLQKQ